MELRVEPARSPHYKDGYITKTIGDHRPPHPPSISLPTLQLVRRLGSEGMGRAKAAHLPKTSGTLSSIFIPLTHPGLWLANR